jgi:hypothetical protein
VRCLACHTNPALASPTATAAEKALRTEGVSCEACHGNASLWKAEHTTWKSESDREKGQQLGFEDLNLNFPAACVKCHIGSMSSEKHPAMDMNHDMIAAGHPELKFDFLQLMSRMPRHWEDKNRHSIQSPDFVEITEARRLRRWQWQGERASEYARAYLLVDRAVRSNSGDKRTPWPEFAEMVCSDCHHALKPAGPQPHPSAGFPRWSAPSDGWNAGFAKEMNRAGTPKPAVIIELLQQRHDAIQRRVLDGQDSLAVVASDYRTTIANLRKLSIDKLQAFTKEEASSALSTLDFAEFLRRMKGEWDIPEVSRDLNTIRRNLLFSNEYSRLEVAEAISRLSKQLYSDPPFEK